MLTLTMQAFGPYRQKQTIDFRLLNDKRLFLITGPTGSGKTMIFDAITYALYGRSSVEGRDVDGLISQHRHPSEVCFVKLTFELKGETYTIYRQPKQYLPKQRGQGLVERPAEARLITKDKIYTSVGEIQQMIEERLGLDANQFRQIVMLPQGEFRKLLEAKSHEKEEIFRKIFKTDFYKAFQERLKEKTKQLEWTIQHLDMEMRQVVEAIDAAGDGELECLKEQEPLNYEAIIEKTEAIHLRLKEETKRLLNTLHTLQEDIKNLDLAYQQGKARNAQIEELAKSREKLNDLKALESTVKEKEQLLLQMAEAKFVQEAEDRLFKLDAKRKALENELMGLEKQLSEMEKHRDEVKKSLEEAYEAYTRLDALKERRNQKQAQRDRLEEWLALSSKVKALGEQLSLLMEEERELNKERQALDQEWKTAQLEGERLEEALQETQDVALQLLYQEARHTALMNAIQLCEDIKAAQRMYEDLAKDYEEYEVQTRAKMQAYDQHYQTYLKSQAGILARGLKDGEPCPVCGSTHHPKKASLIDVVLSEEELEAFRKEIEAMQAERQKRYETLVRTKEKKDTLVQKLQELLQSHDMWIQEQDIQVMESYIRQQAQKIGEHYQNLKQKMETLEQQKLRLEKLKTVQKERLERLNALATRFQSIQETYQQTAQHYHTEKGRLETLEASYGLAQLDLETLEQEIQLLQHQIREIEQRYHTLASQYNEHLQALSTIKAKKESVENQLHEIASEQKEGQALFLIRLKNAQFRDESHYRSILGQLNEHEALEKDVQQYHQDVRYYQTRVAELENLVGDGVPVDLLEIEAQRALLEAEYEAIRLQERDYYIILQRNEPLLDKLKQLYQRTKSQIKTFQSYQYLHHVTNGQNALKLTFERYVLAAYFDEIIQAANVRLREMTDHRYALLRDTEYIGGRGHQGLDLLVYDAYTDQKRSVKTLSGGESFIASLALALGLSDIVSSYAGGIELQTIFIDEGFGSLDPIALDRAIRTLNQLKETGRTVGIISHVEELKERIDVQLEILKTKDGSSIELRI